MNIKAEKHRFLYLYLALACFVGILLIFVFDGYMGRYITLNMDNGRYSQLLESGWWEVEEKYAGYNSFSGERDDVFTFTLKLENRCFTSFSEPVHVSLQDVSGNGPEIFEGMLEADAFGKAEVSWKLPAADLVPTDFAPDSYLTTNMVIQIGEYKGSIKLQIHNTARIVKALPEVE